MRVVRRLQSEQAQHAQSCTRTPSYAHAVAVHCRMHTAHMRAPILAGVRVPVVAIVIRTACVRHGRAVLRRRWDHSRRRTLRVHEPPWHSVRRAWRGAWRGAWRCLHGTAWRIGAGRALCGGRLGQRAVFVRRAVSGRVYHMTSCRARRLLPAGLPRCRMVVVVALLGVVPEPQPALGTGGATTHQRQHTSFTYRVSQKSPARRPRTSAGIEQ